MRISETMIRERDQWLGIVSELTGVEEKAIMGKSRVESVVMARHLLVWVLHKLRGYSYPMLGEMFGRTPATCTHSNNVIEWEHHDERMQGIINKIIAYNDERQVR